MLNLNRVKLFILPALLSLGSFAWSTELAVAQRDDSLSPVSQAALDSMAYCEENPNGYLESRGAQRLMTVTTDCAEFVHKIVAALREANYSPEGYDLSNDEGWIEFIEGALPIIGQDEDVVRVYGRLDPYFEDSVINQVFVNAVIAYVEMDYSS